MALLRLVLLRGLCWRGTAASAVPDGSVAGMADKGKCDGELQGQTGSVPIANTRPGREQVARCRAT